MTPSSTAGCTTGWCGPVACPTPIATRCSAARTRWSSPAATRALARPVIEAMAVGTPVLASRETALPEVVGRAGLLLDPDDATVWADAIGRVLDDASLRTGLVEAGHERAGRFTAEHSAHAGLRLPSAAPVKLTVLCPHFAPDPAPTGEVITRIVLELAERGHELHVVTALPWYTHHRVEEGWGGRLVRREATPWGSITRVHPFPSDKTSLPLRAVSFSAFSALSGVAALGGGRMDAVLAMSPPLPIGLVAWAAAVFHRCPMVFNVQDVFPDVAVDLGKLTDPRLVRAARWLERTTYARRRRHRPVGGPPGQHRRQGSPRPPRRHPRHPELRRHGRHPADAAATAYRRELGIGDGQTVVLYAGNVGFSQSLDLLVEAAGGWPTAPSWCSSSTGRIGPGRRPGGGRPPPERAVRPYQPRERLPEVLATGDLHVVLLRGGLAAASVPSKTYSILAAGRPLLASIDPGTEVTRVAAADCGVSVRPDDAGAHGRGRVPRRRRRRAGRDGPPGTGLGGALGVGRGRGGGVRGAVRGGAPGRQAPATRPVNRRPRPVVSPLRGQSILGEEGGARAKSSSGRKVRSQQGLVFPVALAVVLTLGLALVVYGRATNREDLGAPQLNTVSQPGDHWHSAHGIYICDQYIPSMSVGVEPDPGGIHTHQDGVIHIHPFQTATTGRNARLGDFFAQTGLEVTSSKIQLPDDPAAGQQRQDLRERRRVPGWPGGCGQGPGLGQRRRHRQREGIRRRHRPHPVHQQRDGVRVAFIPEDLDVDTITRPPTAAQLEELAVDAGGRRVRRQHHDGPWWVLDDRGRRDHHGRDDQRAGGHHHAGRRLAVGRSGHAGRRPRRGFRHPPAPPHRGHPQAAAAGRPAPDHRTRRARWPPAG